MHAKADQPSPLRSGRDGRANPSLGWPTLGLALWLALAATACGRHPKTPPPVTVSSGTGAASVGKSDVDAVDNVDNLDPVDNVDRVDSVDEGGEVEEGIASWYGHPYHGRRTSNGEVYDMHKQTAAHRTLPFDTWVKVVNLDNGRSTTVRINDRGPFAKGRIIDLSRSAAEEIDMVREGTAPVRVTILKTVPDSAPALYTVQVGAFESEERARRLCDRLAKNYQDTFLEKAGDLHRVRVGRLQTMAEARQLAGRLSSEPGLESAMVVRLD